MVALVRLDRKKASEVLECLWDVGSCVSVRAADIVEKLSRDDAGFPTQYKSALLDLLAETRQKEVRWRVALIVPRICLTIPESLRVAGILQSYLEDRSPIAKTFAIEGLADLTPQNADLLPNAREVVRALTRTGTAMRARGRLLLDGDRNICG